MDSRRSSSGNLGMEHRSVEDLLEERVTQLDEITRRRNELLVEMYHILQKREDVGAMSRLEGATNEDIDVFLDRFDLRKHPETGRIAHLPVAEFEFYAPSQSSTTPTTSEPSSAAPEGGEQADDASERESSHDELDLVRAYSSADEMDLDDDDLEEEQPPRKRSRHSSSSAFSPHDVKEEDDDGPDELDLLSSPSRPPPPAPRSREGGVGMESPPKAAVTSPDVSASPPRPMRVDDAGVSGLHGRPSGWHGPPTAITLDPGPSFQPSVYVPHISSLSHGAPAIPLPAPWTADAPAFTFPAETDDLLLSPRRPPHPPHAHQAAKTPYTLPALKVLPAEYSKKGKGSKGRKREKEREKAPEGRREDWAPMGANKWGATIRANPAWKRIGRSSKCVSSREWSVAMTELRIVRALERIDSLKDQGRWSFRQVRRQRGVGGLTKTHWDHLMDEMRLMRIDFREERKWKLAVAYSLAMAVVEWHEAGSAAERERRGICVRWVPSLYEPVVAPQDDAEMEAALDLAGLADEEDVEDALVDPSDQSEAGEQQHIDDVLEPGAAIQSALDAAEAPVDEPGLLSTPDDVKLKTEDFEDSSALRNAGDDDAMLVEEAEDHALKPHDGTKALKEEDGPPSETAGLRVESNNPLLGDVSSDQKTQSRSALYAPLRERVAYSGNDLLFLNETDYKLVVTAPRSDDDEPESLALPQPDLLALFSDFQPLELLDIPPPPPTASEGKKKSDRKSDKDDPHKRAEDATYMRLTPMSQFMTVKPTLLGPLKPAQHWKDGQWENIEDIPVTIESEPTPSKSAEESPCSLFQGPPPGRSPIGLSTSLPGSAAEARKRAADYLWSSSEDMLLKSLTERYPGNWQLICDSFNSSRLAMSADKRSPWDCLERWRLKWGTSSHQAQGTPSELTPQAPSPETPSQMTTRGVRRLASANVNAANRAVSSGPANVSNSDTKKRRRHNLMYDTIRKAGKKREATQKANANQRKAAAVHDTHGQYNKLPRLTPIELSRMKAEKDTRDMAENAMRQHRSDAMRQQAMRDQALRMQGGMTMQAQLLQQQQQQLQQQNAAARQSANGAAAAQNVPQIRAAQVNISQQQRTGTPLAATSARMSPQQLMQVQQATQARALAAAQAQAVASGNMNGVPNGVSHAHLSPPYVARAASGSPAMSQAAAAQTPSAVGSPRPPSAQAHLTAAPVVPTTAMQRPAANIAHYFPSVPNIHGQSFTYEQMQQALGLQALLQAQQRQAGSQGASQNGGYSGQ